MFKRGGVYWTCLRVNGKKLQKSLDTSNVKIAKAIEAKLRAEVAEGRYLDKLPGEKKTVAELMKKFIEEYGPKVSEAQQRSYKTSQKNLEKFFGLTPLTKIRPKLIAEYKRLRLSKKRKPATVNRELACFSKAFRIAATEWEWVKENPMALVSRERENNKVIRWLSENEEPLLLEKCQDWLQEIVIFAIHTGMRQGEILNLKWKEVNLFRREIFVIKSKNNEPRTIPISNQLFELLKGKSRVKSISRYVFTACNNQRMDEANLRRAFRKAVKDSGIDKFRFHDLRHTFGSRLAQRGVDLFTISRLMGHKDINTTMRYLHHSTETLKKGIEALNSDYNLTTVGQI